MPLYSINESIFKLNFFTLYHQLFNKCNVIDSHAFRLYGKPSLNKSCNEKFKMNPNISHKPLSLNKPTFIIQCRQYRRYTQVGNQESAVTGGCQMRGKQYAIPKNSSLLRSHRTVRNHLIHIVSKTSL